MSGWSFDSSMEALETAGTHKHNYDNGDRWTTSEVVKLYGLEVKTGKQLLAWRIYLTPKPGQPSY